MRHFSIHTRCMVGSKYNVIENHCNFIEMIINDMFLTLSNDLPSFRLDYTRPPPPLEKKNPKFCLSFKMPWKLTDCLGCGYEWAEG